LIRLIVFTRFVESKQYYYGFDQVHLSRRSCFDSWLFC